MPLNPNIILQAGQGAAKPRNMMQQYGNVLAIKNAQDESELKRNALAQQTAQREAIAAAWDPATGQLDESKLQGALVGSGNLKGLMDYRKNQSAITKNQAATDKTRLEQQVKTLGMMGQFLGGAKTPEQYASNLQGLREVLGPGWKPPGDLVPEPDAWTPEVSQRIGQLALTEKDRLEQAWKEKEFGLKERRTRAAETTAQAAASGKLGSNTRVVYEGEKAEAKKVGGYFGDMYIGINEAASEGNKRIANLTQLDKLLDNLETGKFTGTKVELSKMLSGLGVDPAKMAWLAALPDGAQVASAEAATALSNEMALQLRNPAGGAGMPGAMSDKDREFLTSMIAGLGTTKQGRKTMVEFQRRLNRRNNEVARMAREYRKEHGRLDENFQDQVAQKFQNEDLFSDYHTTGENLPTVRGPADLQAIPPGGFFVGPDGVTRQKL